MRQRTHPAGGYSLKGDPFGNRQGDGGKGIRAKERPARNLISTVKKRPARKGKVCVTYRDEKTISDPRWEEKRKGVLENGPDPTAAEVSWKDGDSMGCRRALYPELKTPSPTKRRDRTDPSHMTRPVDLQEARKWNGVASRGNAAGPGDWEKKAGGSKDGGAEGEGDRAIRETAEGENQGGGEMGLSAQESIFTGEPKRHNVTGGLQRANSWEHYSRGIGSG